MESAPARVAALELIVDRCREQTGGTVDAVLVERYFAGVETKDLRSRQADDWVGVLVSHLDLARGRSRGAAAVRAASPDLARGGWTTGTSIVQVVTDDMPYLVDSVTMAVRRCGLAIDLVIHPVIGSRRDPGGRVVELVPDPEDVTPARADADAEAEADAVLSESLIHLEFQRVPDAMLRTVEAEVRGALLDVVDAVGDWPVLRERTLEVAAEVRGSDVTGASEVAGLIEWLEDHHFTFLAAADLRRTPTGLVPDPSTALGLARRHPDLLTPGSIVGPGDAAIVTKTEFAATVHRPTAMDLVATPWRDADGQLIGERRILGLLTSESYARSPSTIPLVGRKVAEVVRRSGFDPEGHDGKELRDILEAYPRDELFGATVDELQATAMGILALQERHRVRLFARMDRHRRAWSCLVFLPRDRYNTEVRQRIQTVLLQAFGGDRADFTTALSESALARLHFVVHVAAGREPIAVDLEVVEEQLAEAVRSWADVLFEALRVQVGDEAGRDLFDRYCDAFPADFVARVPARAAVADIIEFERVRTTGLMGIVVLRSHGEDPGRGRLKLYVPQGSLALADLLPVLAALGTRVLDERSSAVRVGGVTATLHDLGFDCPSADLDDPAVGPRLADAFRAVWDGRNGDDGFNRLVPAAGLTWQQASVIRAYARYLRQLGFTFSLGYIESTLVDQPVITSLLVELFEARLHPDRCSAPDEDRLRAEVLGALDSVASLDQDRILRTYVALIAATLRTNAFQLDDAGAERPALALKIDTASLGDAPLPRPRFEVFVTSPRVEGVHLRMAAVARGGIRWSDRPEDFRTEVLGLMKAQEVKNSVIVPSGAKGGFVVRRPPVDRAALGAEVLACYRIYIGSLLDVTDNRVGSEVVPPARTVRHDGDDPYLVVAADKGTATFSDTANELAVARGFWLGDAFASGGSVGYDHKKMGITARGAWESVKRHFHRLGRSMEQPFTVVGIGDMSGDVFGNGMLLSGSIALVAAFDHRHVFIDPAPDPQAALLERRRLFELPRSSWADYDRSLISAGGGVFDRSAKSVPLSAEMRAVLGLHQGITELTPAALISAVLRAPVDLLWNGGIGTDVKASSESHADAGDRSNDAVRVDADQLRCKVVGEGGNLGFTQRARVQFARAGGLVNTDAIDNSAGVDTSDHEVNLKILLDAAVAQGDLTVKQRNELLASVTDDVAELVLQDNRDQNRVLVNAVTSAPSMVDLHERYMVHLEGAAHLDRGLEALPDAEELQRRKAAHQGLTVPELAVLLAYTKIHLVNQVLSEGTAESGVFAEHLYAYFPAAVRERFGSAIAAHPLRREIAVTAVVNAMVNVNGITFAFRMCEETGATASDLVRAHMVAMAVADVHAYWTEVCGLDGQVADEVQVSMLLEADRLVERITRWLLRNLRRPLDVDASVAGHHDGFTRLASMLDEVARGRDADQMLARRRRLLDAGVPEPLAVRASSMELLPAAMEVIRMADAGAGSLAEVAAVHFALDDRLGLGALRDRISALPREDRWQTLARSALRDDLNGEQASLTRAVLAAPAPPGSQPSDRVDAWLDDRRPAVDAHLRLAAEAATAEAPPLATLSVVLRELRTLAGLA